MGVTLAFIVVSCGFPEFKLPSGAGGEPGGLAPGGSGGAAGVSAGVGGQGGIQVAGGAGESGNSGAGGDDGGGVGAAPGAAIEFDGTQLVVFGPVPTDDITVEMWMKTTSVAPTEAGAWFQA